MKNSIVLEKPVSAPQRNGASPKSVTAGHGATSQQRRSPGWLTRNPADNATDRTTRPPPDGPTGPPLSAPRSRLYHRCPRCWSRQICNRPQGQTHHLKERNKCEQSTIRSSSEGEQPARAVD